MRTLIFLFALLFLGCQSTPNVPATTRATITVTVQARWLTKLTGDPGITVGMRTGDTPADERRSFATIRAEARLDGLPADVVVSNGDVLRTLSGAVSLDDPAARTPASCGTPR